MRKRLLHLHEIDLSKNNQIYSMSLLLQFYIAAISIHSLTLSVYQFVTCIRHEWRDCSAYSPPATVVLLLFLIAEALLFAIFTAVMLGTQLQAIWNDETVSRFIFPLSCCRCFTHKTPESYISDITKLINMQLMS